MISVQLSTDFKYPDQSKSIKSEKTIKNIIRPWKSIDEHIKWSISVAEFGLLLRNSPFKARASYDHVLASTKSIVDKQNDPYRAEFVNLVEIAKTLDN